MRHRPSHLLFAFSVRFVMPRGLHHILHHIAADGHTGPAAEGTGKQRQVIAAGLHILHCRRLEDLHVGHLIVELIAVQIRNVDVIPDGEPLDGAEMAPIVMGADDHIPHIRGTAVPAGGDLQIGIAPLVENGQLNVQRGDSNDAHIGVSPEAAHRHIHVGVEHIVRVADLVRRYGFA